MLRPGPIAISLLCLASSVARQSWACSAPPPPTVERAFLSARAVFLGKVIAVTHFPDPADPSGRVVYEDATFTILETWKGDVRPGGEITLRTRLGLGSCGVSALNDPPWLEEANSAPTKLSGLWLVYADGDEPFELSGSGRSSPLEFGGIGDLPELYKRHRYSHKKASNRVNGP
jgi:hypothetical protein